MDFDVFHEAIKAALNFANKIKILLEPKSNIDFKFSRLIDRALAAMLSVNSLTFII